MKEAATYGAGAQLPVYVLDDGTYFTQSMAILKMLAMEHGYFPTTPKCMYEVEWFQDTFIDTCEKPERFALMRDDADEAARQACIAIINKFLDKIEARFSDGRAHVGGDQITYADFCLLTNATAMWENANGKHADIKAATAAKMQACPNVQRVLAPMRELCAAQIANCIVSSL